MKYKIGDRVVGTNKDNKGFAIRGTVIEVCKDSICVEFDEYVDGHSRGGKGKDGYCWWLNNEDVKRIDIDKKIVITTDGKETLARLYENGKVVKSATAKCSSEDKFDFNIGAQLAFDRLVEREEEKKSEYYNGKVVCIERGFEYSHPVKNLTVGKIYAVVDGYLSGDNGYKTLRYETLKDLCVGLGHKFIPLVEEKKGE